MVPANWKLEFGNVLAQAERRKRISVSQVATYLNEVNRLPIVVDTETQDRVFREILALARRESLTTYNAAYLELAFHRNVKLATLDKSLLHAAGSLDIDTIPVS